MIPIFSPCPAFVRLGPHTSVAPRSCGGRLSGPVCAAVGVGRPREWYVTLGQTVAPGIALRRESCDAGRRTETPLSATP